MPFHEPPSIAAAHPDLFGTRFIESCHRPLSLAYYGSPLQLQKKHETSALSRGDRHLRPAATAGAPGRTSALLLKLIKKLLDSSFANT